MSKCSLFGVLTYALEFLWFVGLAITAKKLDSYEGDIYFTILFFGILHNLVSIKKAKSNNLCIQAKMKSTLVEPNFRFITAVIYTLVPFISHIAFNLNILGDMLVCAITACAVAHSLSNGSRALNIFFIIDTRTYKIDIEGETINLVIRGRGNYPEKITKGDTIEISHISGNYYLLKNVTKQEENNNAEETQEKELP